MATVRRPGFTSAASRTPTVTAPVPRGSVTTVGAPGSTTARAQPVVAALESRRVAEAVSWLPEKRQHACRRTLLRGELDDELVTRLGDGGPACAHDAARRLP